MNTSLSKIRSHLRGKFPDADIKVSKQHGALTVTTYDYGIRAALEAEVTKKYNVEYIGRRFRDGTMDGEIYGSRWAYRHRFDFVPAEEDENYERTNDAMDALSEDMNPVGREEEE